MLIDVRSNADIAAAFVAMSLLLYRDVRPRQGGMLVGGSGRMANSGLEPRLT